MILTEGKTKVIRQAETPGRVTLETKDELTGGDAAKRETIEGIAVHKTTQTTNVFRFLESRGIPTAFIERHDDRTLLCHGCRMLPLELVIRRYAWGSFLKREPDLVSTHEAPLLLPRSTAVRRLGWWSVRTYIPFRSRTSPRRV